MEETLPKIREKQKELELFDETRAISHSELVNDPPKYEFSIKKFREDVTYHRFETERTYGKRISSIIHQSNKHFYWAFRLIEKLQIKYLLPKPQVKYWLGQTRRMILCVFQQEYFNNKPNRIQFDIPNNPIISAYAYIIICNRLYIDYAQCTLHAIETASYQMYCIMLQKNGKENDIVPKEELCEQGNRFKDQLEHGGLDLEPKETKEDSDHLIESYVNGNLISEMMIKRVKSFYENIQNLPWYSKYSSNTIIATIFYHLLCECPKVDMETLDSTDVLEFNPHFYKQRWRNHKKIRMDAILKHFNVDEKQYKTALIAIQNYHKCNNI